MHSSQPKRLSEKKKKRSAPVSGVCSANIRKPGKYVATRYFTQGEQSGGYQRRTRDVWQERGKGCKSARVERRGRMWTRQAKPEATAASRLAHADEPIGNPKRRGSGRVAAAQFVRVGRGGVTERSRGSPQGSPPEGCHRQMASAGRRPPPPEQPPRRDGGAKMAAAGKAWVAPRTALTADVLPKTARPSSTLPRAHYKIRGRQHTT
ncbi:hypothetical protein HPB51_016744 [Rhipicephalus microplus]|uniref:Uncharacterized protein n=1 Tax=Rhipicephalus microplus TaxID=6941 RepID=A0A9J6DB06_RHIMP|nr:hypothetical protein HPB51_016744 [Rhipicephalus microplus]